MIFICPFDPWQVLAATQRPGVGGENWFQGPADAVRQYMWLFEVRLFQFSLTIPSILLCPCCFKFGLMMHTKFLFLSGFVASQRENNDQNIVWVSRMLKTRMWRMLWFCQGIIFIVWITWNLCRSVFLLVNYLSLSLCARCFMPSQEGNHNLQLAATVFKVLSWSNVFSNIQYHHHHLMKFAETQGHRCWHHHFMCTNGWKVCLLLFDL